MLSYCTRLVHHAWMADSTSPFVIARSAATRQSMDCFAPLAMTENGR